MNDRDKSILWSRHVLALPQQTLILDTETTGLDYGSEIIQIAAIREAELEHIRQGTYKPC